MYEIIDSDIEVLGFLNLSIQIGYMMLKHPVHNKKSNRTWNQNHLIWYHAQKKINAFATC